MKTMHVMLDIHSYILCCAMLDYRSIAEAPLRIVKNAESVSVCGSVAKGIAARSN